MCFTCSGSVEACYEMMTMQHTRDRMKVSAGAVCSDYQVSPVQYLTGSTEFPFILNDLFYVML